MHLLLKNITLFYASNNVITVGYFNIFGFFHSNRSSVQWGCKCTCMKPLDATPGISSSQRSYTPGRSNKMNCFTSSARKKESFWVVTCGQTLQVSQNSLAGSWSTSSVFPKKADEHTIYDCEIVFTGHCAKFGSYSLMDLQSNKVVAMELVQVNM